MYLIFIVINSSLTEFTFSRLLVEINYGFCTGMAIGSYVVTLPKFTFQLI